jgi:DNA-binding XRE family transcriptional regulator
VFFCRDGASITLLSGGLTWRGPRSSRFGAPGLGEARWRLRELLAALEVDGVSHRLAVGSFEAIEDECPDTSCLGAPRFRQGGRAVREPSLVAFDGLLATIRHEAELGGPDAFTHLHLLETRYQIASTVLRGRLGRGLTQRQLSQTSGVPQDTLSEIENGTANPSIRTLASLTGLLGIELHLELRPAAAR